MSIFDFPIKTIGPASQLTSDLANPKIGVNYPELPDPPISDVANRDPLLAKMLDFGILDNDTARILISKDNDRIHEARVQEQIKRTELDIATKDIKRGVFDKERGLFTHIGGVPTPFMQVGTFLGIENDWLRLAVDMIVDPLNLISGVGALTKLGRATRFIARSSDSNITAKLSTLNGGLNFLAQEVLGPKVHKEGVTALRELIEEFMNTQSPELANKVVHGFKKLSKTKFTKEQLIKLKERDPDLANLLVNDNFTRKAFRNALEVLDPHDNVKEASSFLGKIQSGERGIVRFGLPWTDKEISGTFDKFFSAIKANDEEAARFAGKSPTDIDTNPLNQFLNSLGRGTASVLTGVKDAFWSPSTFIKSADSVGMYTREALENPHWSDLEALKASKKHTMEAVNGTWHTEVEVAANIGNNSGAIGKPSYSTNPKGMYSAAMSADNLLKGAAEQQSVSLNRIFGNDPDKLKQLSHLMGDEVWTTVETGIKGKELEVKLNANSIYKNFNDTQKAAAHELRELLDEIGKSAYEKGHIEEFVSSYFPIVVHVPKSPVAEGKKVLEDYLNNFKNISAELTSKAKELAEVVWNPKLKLSDRQRSSEELSKVLSEIFGKKAVGGSGGFSKHTINRTFTNLAEAEEFLAEKKALGIKAPFEITASRADHVIVEYIKSIGKLSIQDHLLEGLSKMPVDDSHLSKWAKKQIGDASIEDKELLSNFSRVVITLDDLLDRGTVALGKEHILKKFGGKAGGRSLEEIEELNTFLSKNEIKINSIRDKFVSLQDDIADFAGDKRKAKFKNLKNRAEKVNEELESLYLGNDAKLIEKKNVIKDSFSEVFRVLDFMGDPVKGSRHSLASKFKERTKPLDYQYFELEDSHRKGIYFHRSVAEDMLSFFDNSSWSNFLNKNTGTIGPKAFGIIDKLNKLAKTSLFNLNPFFHATALTLSNFALLPLPAAARNFKDMTVIGWHSMLKGGVGKGGMSSEKATEAVFRIIQRTHDAVNGGGVDASDIIAEMHKSGVKLGRATLDADDGYDLFDGFMKSMIESLDANDLPSHPLRGIKWWNDLSDRNLWTVLQNSFKVSSWAHIRKAEMLRQAKRLGRNIDSLDQNLMNKINIEAGNIVNQAYGGLAWERLLLNSDHKNFLRFAILAPDWTMSNMLMARDLFVNMPGVKNAAIMGKSIAPDVMLGDMRFHWAMQYNMRAATYGFLFGSLMNYMGTWYLSREETGVGKGKWIHENDNEAIDSRTGIKSRVILPWMNNDGRRQYMDVYRQFSEPLVGFNDPQHYAVGKMGILPRVFLSGMIGQDSMGNPIAGAEDGPFAKIIKQLWATGLQFAPIAVQQAAKYAMGEIPGQNVIIGTAGFPIASQSKINYQRELKLKELNLLKNMSAAEARAYRVEKRDRRMLEQSMNPQRYRPTPPLPPI